MNKEHALKYIRTAMDLRAPQAKSLELFADYLESQAGALLLKTLKKERLPIGAIETASREYFTSVPEGCKFLGFDGRAFPSFTFALATGVGKTRLMGAFVAYLFLVYEIRHFLLVAPGNTIYRKLMEDFSSMNNPKYVFRGIEEINGFTTNIVTKENYDRNPSNTQTSLSGGNKIQINIFNVQQFAEKDRKTKDGELEGKGINAFSENHGKTYFQYLSELDDLVVLLDESHHYHAEAAFASLDRMEPLMGLEFTATPYTGNTVKVGKERVPQEKASIVYAYNLGNAIRDGYVKDPWVGTEADIDFKQFDADSIESDVRKLHLGAYFHERAKVAIGEYVAETGSYAVKPVMLVVAKDTDHAKELRAIIDSDDFRGGQYRGKVIEVHTKLRGDEADENIEKLISLESPNNYVEIVIHVNMLKEGWDVANIYTIVPLRQSASEILTEQTIGRGLRLPYGRKVSSFDPSTGGAKYEYVDRVMVVAHEKYSQILEQAKNSKLIQPSNVEQVGKDESMKTKVLFESKPVAVENVERAMKSNAVLFAAFAKRAENILASSIVAMDEPARRVAIEQKTDELISEIATAQTQSMVSAGGSSSQSGCDGDSSMEFEEGSIFAGFSNIEKLELEDVRKAAKADIENRNIPIPRLIVTPHYGNIVLKPFILDTSRLSKYVTETTVLEEALQAKTQENLFGEEVLSERERAVTYVSGLGSGTKQTPENTVIAGLLDFPLIDYDEQKESLVQLANSAVAFYRSFAKDEEGLKRMVELNVRQIATEIYAQIDAHKELIDDGFQDSGVRPSLPYLLPYNFSKTSDDMEVTLESQVDTFSRTKIYTGFKKACHSHYKFDSSDEARFAYILDRDSSVEDWLRPAPNQFEGLFWRDAEGSANHRYEPDFVVELETEIVMVEVKPESDISNFDVQSKKNAAEKYCEIVSSNIGKSGITKAWRYVIIPTHKISLGSTVVGMLSV